MNGVRYAGAWSERRILGERLQATPSAGTTVMGVRATRADEYRVCANCRHYKERDRFNGECSIKTELVDAGGFGEPLLQKLRRRWNEDARNCESFSGSIG